MNKIEIYTSPFCGYCHRAKHLLDKKQAPYTDINVSGNEARWDEMVTRTGGLRTVPQIFIGERHIGGCDELYELDAKGGLDSLLAATDG